MNLPGITALLLLATTLSAAAAPDANWWSLQPLTRPPVPAGGSSHPVDAFLDEAMEARGVAPVPPADRRTLIRRLAFDLHGLPPSPEDVEAFVADAGPLACDKLVDAMLASPRYGERSARHWLDVIHFADTHGYEHDMLRENGWRYRDYVITSFNRDTPWARFIREQLAPDVFFPDEPALTAGMGFLGAGPWDQSTGSTAPRMFDDQERNAIVTQTMTAFASTTVHCARCHDHKFDPVAQADYYSLQAVFAGIGKGDLTYDEDPALHHERRRWKRWLAAVERKDAIQLLSREGDHLTADWEAKQSGAPARWTVATPDSAASSDGTVLTKQPGGSVLASGPRPEKDTYTLTIPASPDPSAVAAVRLEVLADDSLPKKGPGRQDNGNLHLSEIDVHITPQGGTAERLAIRRAAADFDQEGWTIAHAIDGNEKTAWGIYPRVGGDHMAILELEKKVALPTGAQLTIVLKQLHGGGHLIGRLRVSTTADDNAAAALHPAAVAGAMVVPRAERSPEQRLTLAAHAIKARANERLAQLPAPLRVFGGGPDFTAVASGFTYLPWSEPKPVHVLDRGELDKPGAVAVPGALPAVSVLQGRFDVPDEPRRRAALADWLADTRNPLTWRSIANRVWQQHFLRGLVDTPNDLGRMGSRPSHPALLEWLACEVRDTGSIKRLHRLILTSAAYRRSSDAQGHDAAAAADPDNRLLWHGPRRRLDAESFRDTMLAVSGRLDLTMGGPGVQQFKLGKAIQITPSVDYTPYDWDSPGAGRRSIYRFVYRGVPDPFMEAMDFPDAAASAAERPFSASPMQALALLHSDFVLHHSQHLAARVKGEPDPIRAAVRLMFQRQCSPDEHDRLASYAGKHGLAAMVRVLCNSNEFLFVE